MNAKWKIALLTLLGFSTAACCGTKKAAKSDDATNQDIYTNEEDPRVMLMYGVPFPDGRVAVPVDENGQPVDEAAKFPDGSIAKPISDEDAMRLIEEINAEKAAQESQE